MNNPEWIKDYMIDQNSKEEQKYLFTLDEIRALHRWMYKEFVPHDDEIIAVAEKIVDIIEENEGN